ncbi:MAG: hypothetical protein IJ106_12265 [Parasporobacterium sp.]|nr:hypothetical protein [Parasporobacterium sp.]
MHSSDSNTTEKKGVFSRTWVRVAAAVILFVVFVLAIAAIVFRPYGRIYSAGNQFDLVVLGASESMWGADSEVLTRDTGMNTCILASERCDYAGKYEMLKAFLAKDVPDLVILDASNTSLVRDNDTLKEVYLTKVNGLFAKIGTTFRRFSFWEDEYDTAFAEVLNSGVKSWGTVFDGTYEEIFRRHGYEPQYYSTLTEDPKDIAAIRDIWETDLDFDDAAPEMIREIIRLCKEYGVDLMIITFPVSAQSNWTFSGWDKFHGVMTGLAEETDVPYYDFNLLENRSDYYPDATCFRDFEHLNADGAAVFSAMVAELVNCRKAGTPYPYRFYDSYEEAKEHSYYAQFQ